MASLTETAFYARKTIKFGSIGLVIFIFARLAFNMFLDYIRETFPPSPIVNNAFGKLPSITFPQSASPSGEITFILQTIDGNVPDASDSARVFFMPKSRINLLSLSRAQAFVGKLGFTTSPRQLTETLYRWIDLKSPLRSIEYDTVSNLFTLNYLFQHDLALFLEKQIPSPAQARTETLNFLQSAGIRRTDIDTISPTIQYLKLVGNQLEPTTSQSQADAVKVDYFRNRVDGMLMVTDKPGEANISFILSGAQNPERRILFVKYQSWPVDFSSNARYKVKSSSEAWTEFLEGKSYIASFPQGQNNIPITDVFLAYYDSPAAQLFLQPIFVISGEGSFTAYIPAIAAPWTQ